MKKRGKLLSLVLALAMSCSLALPAMAAEEEDAPAAPYAVPADVKGKLVILHTNDTHGSDLAVEGQVIGAAGVAQLKNDFEAAGADVLLLSAGDTIMGKPLVSADKGVSEFQFLTAVGYDAMTVGNHELDFGYDNLKALAAGVQFPILCANMKDEKTGKPVFDTNKLFTTAGGIKVGVFGLATPETLTKADASKMPGITFDQTDALYKTAQAQVDALKKDGADLVVAVGHLGVADESVGNRSMDVAKNVTGIDLFIDGHSHNTTPEIVQAVEKAGMGTGNVVNGTKLVSTGTALSNVGVVVYDKADKTLTDSLVSAASYTKTDPVVAKLVADRDAAVNAQYGEKIAATEVDLNGTRSGGDAVAVNTKQTVTFPAGQGGRTAETNLGDFAADAILWQAKQTLGEDKVDAALTNGGGIRETIAKGDVSKLDLLAVFPFGNTVATIDVTGAQLLEALEAATYTTPDAIGAFPQVSGLDFVITTANSYDQGEQYPASTYYAPKSIQRVELLTVGDEVFDPAATYTIATNDFTAKGGDTYGVFKTVGGWKDVGVSLETALIDYTTTALKGTISAAQYGTAQGRITVVPADVQTDDPCYDAVVLALAAGRMQGTGDGFAPAGELTRAEVLQALYNMERPASVGGALTDVAGQWYADAANWALDAKLIDGTAFGGNAVTTRAEAAQLVADYCAAKGADGSALTAEGDPAGAMTRGELAQLLLEAAALIAAEDAAAAA